MSKFASAVVFAFVAVVSYADGTYSGSWSGLSGVVTVPSSYATAPVTASEITDFSNVTKVVFEGNTAITAISLKSELALNAELSGAGAFAVTNCTKVTVNSNNKAFAGKFAFYNTPVYVSRRYGLGSAAEGDGNCAITTESPSSGTSKMYLVFTGTGDDLQLENDIAATRTLEIYPASTTDILVINANLRQQVKNSNINFKNKVKMTGGTIGNVAGMTHFYFNIAGGEAWLEEGATLYSASSTYFGSAGGTFHLKGTLAIGSNIALYTQSLFICEKENVLNSKPLIYSGAIKPNWYLDLNGFDQTIKSIGFVAGTESGPSCYRIHSDEPATLNIAPQNKNHHTDGAHPYFTGKVSVSFTPASDAYNPDNWFVADVADGANTQISPATGTFTVTGGKMAFKYGWGWGGDVVVSGGQLSCESVTSLATTNGTLTVSGTGKLIIGEGVTLNVAGATFGEVTLPRYQTYTVAQIQALGVPDTMVDGTGSVYVGHPSVLEDWVGWPSEGEARIPNDTVVDVTDADVAKVANLSSIVLGRGATVRCVNATTPLTIAATVVGAGTIAADGAISVTLDGSFADVTAHGDLSFKDSAIVVADTNKLTVGASAMFAGQCTLSLADTAALEIAEGAMPTVYGGTFGTAELENNRVYTTAELNALSANNAVTGAGTLSVGSKHIPGTWAGWPEVGTVTKAEIPDNAVATIDDADVEKVEALSSIEMGIGAKIYLRATGSALTLSAKLVGAGPFVADQAAGLTLAGDNSGLIAPGAFCVTSTPVNVTHRYGLGGPNTGAATFYSLQGVDGYAELSAANTVTFGDGTRALTNEVPVRFANSWLVRAFDKNFPYVQKADFTRYYSSKGSNRLFCWGDFTMAAGTFGNDGQEYLMTSGIDNARRTVIFEAGTRIDMGDRSFYPLGYDDVELRVDEFITSDFHPNTVVSIMCMKENVLSGIQQYKPYTSVSSAGGAELDLNGHDQMMQRLFHQDYAGSKLGKAYYPIVNTSDDPATLTVSNVAAAVNRVAPVAFKGNLSVHFAGTDVYAISNGVSTATGSLRVTGGGTVGFCLKSSFHESRDIVIDGSTVIVDVDAREEGVFSKKANMAIANDGNLKLFKDETVKSLKVGDGYVEKGTYGAPGSGMAKTLDCLAGSTGTLTVRRSSPASGLVIIIH